MKKILGIYTFILLAMMGVLVGIDWFMGDNPSKVFHRSFLSLFKYLDILEYFLILFFLFYPFISFFMKKLKKMKTPV